MAALKRGTCHVIEKPFADEGLLAGAAPRRVAGPHGSRRPTRAGRAFLRRVETPSERERRVLDTLVAGATIAEIDSALAIDPRTVEI